MIVELRYFFRERYTIPAPAPQSPVPERHGRCRNAPIHTAAGRPCRHSKGSVLLSRYQHINPVWFSNALTHPHDKSGGFQFIQRTLDRHGTAGQDCGNGCDREADKQDSVLVLLTFGEHSVQHPAVHDLCGAADWKSCQRSGKWHTGRQWCVYRHKFKIHSVCSSFFFARLDK